MFSVFIYYLGMSSLMASSCAPVYQQFNFIQVFFHPEIYDSDFTTSLPDMIDKCVQSSPIDTRRALYKVKYKFTSTI